MTLEKKVTRCEDVSAPKTFRQQKVAETSSAILLPKRLVPKRPEPVVGAGLCDGEGERAYTGYAPHIIRNVSANVFSLRRFGIFLPKRPPPCFCRNVRNP